MTGRVAGKGTRRPAWRRVSAAAVLVSVFGRIAHDGTRVVEWPIAPMLGELAAVRVTLADLDGDARAEVLVSVLEEVSNGMALQSWTTCVLDGRNPARGRACVAAADVPFLSLPTGPPEPAPDRAPLPPSLRGRTGGRDRAGARRADPLVAGRDDARAAVSGGSALRDARRAVRDGLVHGPT